MVQKSSRKATPLARRANSTGNKHNLSDFKSLYLNVYIVLNYFLAFGNKHFGCYVELKVLILQFDEMFLKLMKIHTFRSA